MVKPILIACALLVAGALAFSVVCPCRAVPGFYLFGKVVVEPVNDWSFVNDVPLCQMEVTTWRPHSINLNCMSANQRLYISCSHCTEKSWSHTALDTRAGRIRVGELVYPVSMSRVTDATELDIAWSARIAKLGIDPSEPRPSHWWTFNLTTP